ncbi:hypothetical protein SRABI106_04693 [Rahnella aquatilis]|nr:hypothetical protein SRABI106_04693 [Rahnella aquatilis]
MAQRAATVEITRHGSRHYARHTGAQPLNGCKGNQHRQTGGHHGARRTNQENHQAGQDHRFTANIIGKRAVNQLRAAVCQQIGCHHPLYRARFHGQTGGHVRDIRHINGLCHLPDSHQQNEHDKQVDIFQIFHFSVHYQIRLEKCRTNNQ